MKSVISYPDRGPWGSASWRGNCSGHVIRDMLGQYRPKVFVDCMVGSGTSLEVARELGIEAYGLDLHQGFNVLSHSLLQAVGKEADLVFSHPPYHDMIAYSGAVWGQEAHPDDLSRCASEEDFLGKMQVALMNQRDATRAGGLYATLIGDLRRNGRYSSYQAELIARLPRDELAAVIIKTQHNCQSDRKAYRAMRHPAIAHEYLIVWEKPRRIVSFLETLATVATEQMSRIRTAWRAIVRAAMMALGGTATTQQLYDRVAQDAPDRLQQNPNWKAKIRQVLQTYEDFSPVDRGIWQLT